jgi:beta-glucuronidase
MKKIFLLTSVVFIARMLGGQTADGLQPLIQNVYQRDVQSLNGSWHYLVDPLETGYYDYRRQPSPNGFFKEPAVDNVSTYKEYDFDTAPVMSIPGDWNTQQPDLFYYEGTVWFRRTFVYQRSGRRAFLYFGAINYDAKIYLNGTKVGEHVGGYTPFNFEVSELLTDGTNSLVVKVDNKRRADAVPTHNFDWFNYGGITRDILLVETPATFIRTYRLGLSDGHTDVLRAQAELHPPQAGIGITLEIPELQWKQTATTGADGRAVWEAPAAALQRWSPEQPKRYDVQLTTVADTVRDQIGFRHIATRDREILLNGRPVFLKGISIHEEAAFRNGRIYAAEEDRTLLQWAKELGCNYVRLAHYPHNEQMVREAERMGLMVWSEIPVYWTIQWDDPTVYDNALNQLNEMIERDQNRANIIIWSIANETPHGAARDTFLASLAAAARRKDNSRLISMAMERRDHSPSVLSVNDAMSRHVDVISFNQYVGWYDGTNEKLDRVRWDIDYRKPIIISEFGGGAVYGRHGPDAEIWTEEYQADLYRRTLRMIDERMPPLAGLSPWVLKDFRSSRRLLPQIQDGFNRKGLVSDKGGRKKAFFVLQQWYNKR